MQARGRDSGITTMGLMLPRAAEEDDPSDVAQVVEDNQRPEGRHRHCNWRIREGKCLQRHKTEQTTSALSCPDI